MWSFLVILLISRCYINWVSLVFIASTLTSRGSRKLSSRSTVPTHLWDVKLLDNTVLLRVSLNRILTVRNWIKLYCRSYSFRCVLAQLFLCRLLSPSFNKDCKSDVGGVGASIDYPHPHSRGDSAYTNVHSDWSNLFLLFVRSLFAPISSSARVGAHSIL